MPTLTIHALDDTVEKRIRAKAKRDGRSLNLTLKELLASSVGVSPSAKGADHREDFAEFHGVWTSQDASDFQAATADLETVDQADWQP